MKNIKTISEFISENSEELLDPETQALRSKIEKAIRETLVVQNTQSIKYAVNKIIGIVDSERLVTFKKTLAVSDEIKKSKNP